MVDGSPKGLLAKEGCGRTARVVGMTNASHYSNLIHYGEAGQGGH
jgi:hypothetical protein